MAEVVTELAKRLNGIAIISSDLEATDLNGTDIESMTAHIVSFFKESKGPRILNKQILDQIMQSHVPEAIVKEQVIQRPRITPITQHNFSIRNLEVKKTGAKASDFAEYFNNRLDSISVPLRSVASRSELIIAIPFSLFASSVTTSAILSPMISSMD